MSERSCNTCIAAKKTGGKCTRSTCKYGPKCWQHTQIQDGLAVKPSTVPGAGQGLFAKRTFHNNEKIATYTGERITQRQLDQRYGAGHHTLGEYVIKKYGSGKNSVYIDARKTNSGVARYANDCHGSSQDCNAEFKSAGKSRGKNGGKAKRSVIIKATKNIRPNTEILTSYGNEYWQNK